MKPALKRSGSGAAGNTASNRPRPGKPIAKTVEMLRSNEQARRSGKGKERGVLLGLHEVIKAHENLPGAVQVERFAEARALEVAALRAAVKVAAASNTSRAFQSLPRHLRRRAASHNPRRVPKYMKSRAAAEIDPGDNIVRLQRRKAKLRARGNAKGQSRTDQLRLRQRGKNWLATHMYHAKRFHMFNIWGYRLPRTPTLKSFRSSYRAARRKAILRDTSYIGILELESTRDILLGVLGAIVGGGTFAGTRYEGGAYSALVQLYEPGQFPRGLIGPAELLWQHPGDLASADTVTLWMRLHPSIFEETWGVVKSLANGQCRLRDLRPEVESFDLTGPTSGVSLLRCLPLSASEPEENRQMVVKTLLRDPAEVPDNLIMKFNVVDPRLSYPPRRLSPGQTPPSEPFNSRIARADLSSRSRRMSLSCPTYRKADLDDRRRIAGLPGRRLTPTERDDRIPVVVVKRCIGPSDDRAAAFHGYTVLFPAGWSMALLPSFVYCGVRLGGLQEAEVQHREAGVPSFPEHYGAVCPAGKRFEDQSAREAEGRWLRKPPGKRPEFTSLRVQWPFQPDWAAILLNDQEHEELRTNDGTTFRPWLLDSYFVPFLQRVALSDNPNQLLLSAINAFRRRRELEPFSAEQGPSLLKACLCHMRIDVLGRGSPSDMAMVCGMNSVERSQWLLALEADEVAVTPSALDQLGNSSHEVDNTIGFVSTGNISLTRGKGHGLATVSLAGYLSILRSSRNAVRPELALVKVRNRNSRTYRLASLQPVQTV